MRINLQLIMNFAILLAIPLTGLLIMMFSSADVDHAGLIFDYITTSSIQ